MFVRFVIKGNSIAIYQVLQAGIAAKQQQATSQHYLQGCCLCIFIQLMGWIYYKYWIIWTQPTLMYFMACGQPSYYGLGLQLLCKLEHAVIKMNEHKCFLCWF